MKRPRHSRITNQFNPIKRDFCLCQQIEVGGMHIKKKANPLPADTQKFIDEAEHGVIYSSLGSNLNPSAMPVEKQEAIIKALSKLEERVQWKWDDENAKVDQKKFTMASLQSLF